MPLEGVTWILMLVPPPPLLEISGSGKRGTPCERMHAENFSACAPGAPEPEAEDAPELLTVVVAAVVDPR